MENSLCVNNEGFWAVDDEGEDNDDDYDHGDHDDHDDHGRCS